MEANIENFNKYYLYIDYSCPVWLQTYTLLTEWKIALNKGEIKQLMGCSHNMGKY